MERNPKSYQARMSNHNIEVILRKESYGIIVRTLVDGKIHSTFTKYLPVEVQAFVNNCIIDYLGDE